MSATSPRSRIIPAAYRSARLTLEGEAPLLMHKDTLLDPTHPLTRVFRELTRKQASARTIDDEMNIARIEWEAGIYHDDDIGPYMPGTSVKAMLAGAGTRWHKGATIDRALIVVQTKLPVVYDGPRDIQGLWDEGYRDMRGAVNSGRNRGRVMRCRPMFEEWGLVAEIAYDPKELDRDLLESVAEFTQVRGIGDFRPDFGTFKATWDEES